MNPRTSFSSAVSDIQSLLGDADPATAGVPIVCVSGTLARGGRVPADLPHDDALAKPFAVAALIATVARWTPPRHDADGG